MDLTVNSMCLSSVFSRESIGTSVALKDDFFPNFGDLPGEGDLTLKPPSRVDLLWSVGKFEAEDLLSFRKLLFNGDMPPTPEFSESLFERLGRFTYLFSSV